MNARRIGPALDLVDGRVEMAHGAGGRSMQQLIAQVFARELDNVWLSQGDDGARLPGCDARLVMATDAHVVSPLFFPGGDIGALSVHGTINDVAVMGARPLWLAAGFVLEEGFPLADLARIVASMARASREAGVPVVTGDTKVVEHGKADGVFITTTGVGALRDDVDLSGSNARPGDVVLLSGTIGDHGMAILSVRENLAFESPIISDTAALHSLIAGLLDAVPDTRVLRDPTRGGLAATLNEIAEQSAVGIALEESRIPVRPAVLAACELLGLDPLNIANEGRVVAICPREGAERAVAAMRAHPLGTGAAIIGEVVADERRFVRMSTRFGGQRMIDWLAGDALPRIC
ncbi:MAG: hydrogenase expression/formation protein HypE [Pseudomonadota bacterium]|jgi:hydrogenase expression/formation protein HypE